MKTSQTILMTGATSGLGLNTVKQLSKLTKINLIIGVRNPQQAHHLRSIVSKERLIILPLDLDSLDSVRHFAAETLNHLASRQLSAMALQRLLVE